MATCWTSLTGTITYNHGPLGGLFFFSWGTGGGRWPGGEAAETDRRSACPPENGGRPAAPLRAPRRPVGIKKAPGRKARSGERLCTWEQVPYGPFTSRYAVGAPGGMLLQGVGVSPDSEAGFCPSPLEGC